MKRNITNIIVAAGRGSRFGADRPKQFCMLESRPVLMHTIERLRDALPDSDIIVVINRDMESLWKELCAEYQFISPTIVYGGDSRWQSVKNALSTIANADDRIVTVHDGARPIISSEMIHRIIRGVEDADGVIPVVPVTDSLRHVNTDGSSEAIDRSDFRAVQTPQAFRADRLIDAYSMPYSSSFTDDASVMEAAGYCNIRLVDGDTRNIKITNPADLEIASILLHQR